MRIQIARIQMVDILEITKDYIFLNLIFFCVAAEKRLWFGVCGGVFLVFLFGFLFAVCLFFIYFLLCFTETGKSARSTKEMRDHLHTSIDYMALSLPITLFSHFQNSGRKNCTRYSCQYLTYSMAKLLLSNARTSIFSWPTAKGGNCNSVIHLYQN